MSRDSLLPADHLGLFEARRRGLLEANVRKAVVHGNPDRVEAHAGYLREARLVARKRGFVSYVGYLGEEPVLITSSGMGAGSASIVFEELVELGIERIVRVGTCGSYRALVKPGDLVVPSEVLIDGPVLRYVYPDYLRERPPVDIPWLEVREGFYFVRAFDDVVKALRSSVEEVLARSRRSLGYDHAVFVGPVHDKDILHAWRGRYSLNATSLEMMRSRVLRFTIATDMETGALLTVAHIRGVKAGSILVVVDFYADEEIAKAQDEAMRIAYAASLEALRSL